MKSQKFRNPEIFILYLQTNTLVNNEDQVCIVCRGGGSIFAKFHEIKILANRAITLLFTDIGKSYPSRKFLNDANMSFKTIR